MKIPRLKETNMKIKMLFALILLAQISIAQNLKITVKSETDKETLSDVLFYSKNELIGKTNEKGEVFLNLNLLDTIQIVKEDFIDLSVRKTDLKAVIFLKKLDFILLDEVVISKLDVNQILDKVENNLINHIGFYNNAKVVQYFNILTVGNDTLHYLNNRMKFKSYDGNYINAQNKIIKNFYFDNNYLVYKLADKRVTFVEGLNSRWPFIGNKDGFLMVLKNSDKYDFDLIATDEYYKISYKSKRNKKFSYNGYLIIDKGDFGTYELEMKLVPNSGNIGVTHLHTEKQNLSYLINESNIFYSMTKIDNEYVVNWASYNFTATHTKGDFKGAKFVSKVRVEATPNFVDEKMYKFNILRYEKF
jgi:hypothetical protein